MRIKFIAVAFAVTILSSAAHAQVTVDGVLDSSYGAAKSTVTYVPGTPEANFATPTPFTDAIGYSIYLTSDANKVYGYLAASGPGAVVGNFANLYFDIDPANGNGSDIGFEITNARGFVAGGAGDYSPVAINYFANNGIIEFSIPNSAFMGPLPGLAAEYPAGQQFAAIGDTVTLRLSQSFGYSVAGGATYGNDRLGSVRLGGAAVGAVPEPATWALMVFGFGAAGTAMRRRKTTATIRFA